MSNVLKKLDDYFNRVGNPYLYVLEEPDDFEDFMDCYSLPAFLEASFPPEEDLKTNWIETEYAYIFPASAYTMHNGIELYDIPDNVTLFPLDHEPYQGFKLFYPDGRMISFYIGDIEGFMPLPEGLE